MVKDNEDIPPVDEKPYPGPIPFEYRHRSLFFGREHEADELLSLVTAHPVVLLYSQSGAGKTSLLNAGLIPLLEQAEFKIIGPARVRGRIPEGFDHKHSNPYVYNAITSLAGMARDFSSATVRDYLKATLPIDKDGQLIHPCVLIFDQFEELFTLNPELWRNRSSFFAQVEEALTDPSLRVLFAMREDFIAEMDPFETLLAEKLRTRFRLERLRPPAALAAIEGPLTVAPWKELRRQFAPGVAEKLVHNLREIPNKTDSDGNPLWGEFIEPVQLQVVCQAIWDKLKSDERQITFRHLEDFGDVNQALMLFYERCLKTATAEANKKRQAGEPELREGTLRAWFDRELITETGKRSMVFRGSRETSGIPNSAVDELEARHIIRAELRDGERWYELSHDRFLQPIKDSYRNWLLEQPGAEQTRRRLEDKTAKWFSKRKDPELLLDAGEVLEARRWLDSDESAGITYSDRLLAFVNASEKAIEQRRAEERMKSMRRLQWALGTAILLLVTTVFAGFFAVRNANAARMSAEEATVQRELALREAKRANNALNAAEMERQRALEQTKIAEANELEALRQRELAEAATAAQVIAANTARTEATAARSAEAFAQSQAIASVASNMLSQPFSDPEVAALIGFEAFNLASSDQALDVLRNSMTLLGHSRSRMAGHTEPVNSVSFSADGQFLVSASDDSTVRVWDHAGKLLKNLQSTEFNIEAASFENAVVSPNGQFIAANQHLFSISDDRRQIVVWDAYTSEVVAKLDVGVVKTTKRTSAGSVSEQETQIIFSKDGRRLLFAGPENLRAWEVETWQPSELFPVTTKQGPVKGAVLSPDGRYAFVLSDNPFAGVAVRDLVSNTAVADINTADGRPIGGAFSPDGKLIALINELGWVEVWSLESGKRLRATPPEEGLTSVTFSPDGQLIVTENGDETACVWSSGNKGGLNELAFNDFALRGHTGPIVGTAFSPNGDFVVTASADGTARIWDTATGASLVELRGHSGALRGATFSPDGTTIATASADGTARLWNTLGDPGILNFDFEEAVFSSKGNYVAASSLNGLVVMDARTGRKLWSRRCDKPQRASFSPDDSRLAAACYDRTAPGPNSHVLDAKTGAVLFSLGDSGSNDTVVFSADGKLLLTTHEGYAEIWDAGTGKSLGEMEFGSHSDLLRATLSPDGNFIVGATGEKVARLWDIKTGRQNISPDVEDILENRPIFSNRQQVRCRGEHRRGLSMEGQYENGI